jgi:hypothetical protein
MFNLFQSVKDCNIESNNEVIILPTKLYSTVQKKQDLFEIVVIYLLGKIDLRMEHKIGKFDYSNA